MFDSFIQNIKEKQLLLPEQKVLLALSGGIDSMVLLHLFEKSEFEYGIAHCNFQLRGEESDSDEEFVKKQVLIHGVPAFIERFDTEEYAKLRGISIEMAAREQRYQFFEEVRKANGYDFIATAHHQDDLIETFFLNLSRKTGIKGLTGIKEKAGKIIRPLLFTNREMIEDYASQNYIDFCEDSSNQEIVFQRNFLRHRILPLFSELNPSFSKNVLASIENLREAELVYQEVLDSQRAKVLGSGENGPMIYIKKLLDSKYPKLLLLEILSEFNFNPVVIEDAFQSLESDSGKQFYSRSHRLVKDRDMLFILERKDEDDKLYYIEENDIELFAPMDITLERIEAENFEMIRERNTACIDIAEVQFPLLIRKWKQGDYFQPLGMEGFKKVSDFFIDQKLPLHEKENTWLLCSGKKIIWIMGHRLDNRFKVKPGTEQVLKITLG